MNKAQRRRARKKKVTRPPKRSQLDRSLATLGFSTYSQYLHSPLWSRVRAIVFNAKGRLCCLCGDHAVQIHHSDYRLVTLRGLVLEGLHPICVPCHEYIEVLPCGGKRPRHLVNKLFLRMMTDRH